MPANNTQRIVATFEEQVGRQYADNVILDLASQDTQENGRCDLPKTSDVHSASPTFTSKRYFYKNGRIFDTTSPHAKGIWKECSPWKDKQLENDVLKLIELSIAPKVNEESINLYTMCKKDGVLYRADPHFRNERCWHDWANICWGKNKDLIPAQVILFIEIRSMTEPIQVGGYYIRENGMYAIAHMLPVALSDVPIDKRWGDHKAHQDSLLFMYSRKKMKGRYRPQLFLIDTARIVSPCIGVEDLDAEQPHCFLFLKSKSDWQDIFLEHVKETVKED
jgi:hypothetical protein